MAQPLYPPAGPQSIGQVLDSGFRIFQMSLVSCLVYGALSMIAGELPNIYFIATGRPPSRMGGGSLPWTVLFVVGSLIMLVLYAAIVFRQHGIAVGRRLGTSVELSMGIRRLPAYLGLLLLSTLVILAVPLLVGVVLASTGVRLTPDFYREIFIAGVLVLIPVLYLATFISIAPLSLLLDRKGPAQALAYAVRLVHGNWWRTTAILTVAVVLVIVFYFVVMLFVGLTLPLVGATDVAAVTAATSVVSVIMGSIALPFMSAVLLATYGELKVRREGLDLEQRVAGIASS